MSITFDLFSIWAVVRWLHLLAAITWIGGMIFILLILLPVLRPSLPAVQRTLLFARVGRRYATISWVSLAILVVTGYANAERRQVPWSRMTEYSYGETLHMKLTLVGFVIPITLFHAFYFGKKMEQVAERVAEIGETPELAAERRKLQIGSGILSAVNLILNIAIVFLAASLAA